MTDLSDYLDDVFNTLSSDTRRRSLNYIREESGERVVSVEDIASYLSGNGVDPESIKTSLYHNHLPKLANLGWIDYDEREDYVRDATVSEDVKDQLLLDYLSDVEDEDSEYLDDVFSMLSNETRRKTLYYLGTEGRYSTLTGLSKELSDDIGDVDSLKIRLHHTHLPVLDEHGWVDYDADTEKVSLTVDMENDRDGLLLKYLRQAYEQET